MKETPLNKSFEDAMRKLDRNPALHHVAEHLAMIQHAVIDFRDAGLEMTLTVRPERRGFALELEDDDNSDVQPIANGEIVAGDIRLDFIVKMEDSYKDCMSLEIYRDGESVLKRRSVWNEDNETWDEQLPETDEDESDDDGGYDGDDDGDSDNEDREEAAETHGVLPPPHDLKSAITKIIIDIKARQDFASQFNVGPNGIAGNAVEKPFPVAAPIKLKKPDGP